MTESILTGVFTLLGVLLGGVSSWIITIYTNRRDHESKVLEKQNELCLNMLIALNEMIDRLPKTNEELIAFKEYLSLEFYPKRDSEKIAEEMLYLTDDIRATFFTICIFAENDYQVDCNYEVLNHKIITYRNVFTRILREDLKIFLKEENEKAKNKRFDKYLKEVIKSYSDDE